MNAPVRTWSVGGDQVLHLDQPCLMGIVNATPDSFSDGGQYDGVEALVAHARQLVAEGADCLDIGGESTRPGADAVPDAEQIQRTQPVIRELAAAVTVPLSIDTTRSAVARAALDAGATIINDVSAGQDDPAMLSLAAERECGLILMHRRCVARVDQYSDQYETEPVYDGDVVASVRTFLADALKRAEAAGVDPSRVVLDPGLGFGKSVEQNLALIRRIEEIVVSGRPLLGALSRKSFVGRRSGVEAPAERLAGSLAGAVALYHRGVRVFRVHDVAQHRAGLAVAAAIEADYDSFLLTPPSQETRTNGQ